MIGIRHIVLHAEVREVNEKSAELSFNGELFATLNFDAGSELPVIVNFNSDKDDYILGHYDCIHCAVDAASDVYVNIMESNKEYFAKSNPGDLFAHLTRDFSIH